MSIYFVHPEILSDEPITLRNESGDLVVLSPELAWEAPTLLELMQKFRDAIFTSRGIRFDVESKEEAEHMTSLMNELNQSIQRAETYDRELSHQSHR
jgi:hypothetical protein